MLYLSALLKTRYPAVYAQIKAACERFEQPLDEVPETRDIWVRDFMPIPLPDGNLLEYRYDPDYLKDPKEAESRSEPADICERMGIKTVKTNLIIDGGNVIRRGNTLIMTDKVVTENSLLFTKEVLMARLREEFQVEKVVFLPKDKKDIYGHADSMVRFIDDKTVLVNYYYEDYQPIIRPLEENGLVVKTLKLDGVDWKVEKYWPYLNFLQTEKLMLVPAVEAKYDEMVLAQFEHLFPAYRDKIAFISMPAIIAEDGALNCISWTRT